MVAGVDHRPGALWPEAHGKGDPMTPSTSQPRRRSIATAALATATVIATGTVTAAVAQPSAQGPVERGAGTGEIVRTWNAVAGEAAKAASIARRTTR